MKNFNKVKKNVSETIASHVFINNILIGVAMLALIMAIVEPHFYVGGLIVAFGILTINFIRNMFVIKAHDKKLAKIKKCNEK